MGREVRKVLVGKLAVGCCVHSLPAKGRLTGYLEAGLADWNQVR